VWWWQKNLLLSPPFLAVFVVLTVTPPFLSEMRSIPRLIKKLMTCTVVSCRPPLTFLTLVVSVRRVIRKPNGFPEGDDLDMWQEDLEDFLYSRKHSQLTRCQRRFRMVMELALLHEVNFWDHDPYQLLYRIFNGL
jgi:hypothetical protein